MSVKRKRLAAFIHSVSLFLFAKLIKKKRKKEKEKIRKGESE